MLHNSLEFSSLTLNPHWAERRGFNPLCSTSGSSQDYSGIIPNLPWRHPKVCPGLSQISLKIFPSVISNFPRDHSKGSPGLSQISLEIIPKFPQDYPGFPIRAQKQGAPAPRGTLAFLDVGLIPGVPVSGESPGLRGALGRLPRPHCRQQEDDAQIRRETGWEPGTGLQPRPPGTEWEPLAGIWHLPLGDPTLNWGFSPFNLGVNAFSLAFPTFYLGVSCLNLEFSTFNLLFLLLISFFPAFIWGFPSNFFSCFNLGYSAPNLAFSIFNLPLPLQIRFFFSSNLNFSPFIWLFPILI